MKKEGIGDTNYNESARNDPQELGKGTGRFKNQMTSGNRPDDSIIKIGQNNEKSPGDLKKLAITRTPIKTIG